MGKYQLCLGGQRPPHGKKDDCLNASQNPKDTGKADHFTSMHFLDTFKAFSLLAHRQGLSSLFDGFQGSQGHQYVFRFSLSGLLTTACIPIFRVAH